MLKNIIRIINIPDNIKIIKNNNLVIISNSKLSLSYQIHKIINFIINKGNLFLTIDQKYKKLKKSISLLGTIYSITKNFIIGLTNGFDKVLKLKGVGYKFKIIGNSLILKLGHSHSIRYNIPKDINISVKNNTTLAIYGYCKQEVGNIAAEIRKKKPVDIYKGKGIKYDNENIILKEIKKK